MSVSGLQTGSAGFSHAVYNVDVDWAVAQDDALFPAFRYSQSGQGGLNSSTVQARGLRRAAWRARCHWPAQAGAGIGGLVGPGTSYQPPILRLYLIDMVAVETCPAQTRPVHSVYLQLLHRGAPVPWWDLLARALRRPTSRILPGTHSLSFPRGFHPSCNRRPFTRSINHPQSVFAGTTHPTIVVVSCL